MIIQIIGLPGAGKTVLAEELSNRVNGFHINADKVRQGINSDLGFEHKDRIEQARRMGCLARLVEEQGLIAVVDFVCPTYETREAFGKADIIVWVDRIKKGRFEDTNKMWEDPLNYDIRIEEGKTVDEEVEEIIIKFSLFDWKKPSTLMLGRYQPWHEGHHALYVEAGKRTDQVVLGVRNTHKTSEKDPLSFTQVKEFIDKDPFMKDAMVIKMPNITNIVYGRDVGYLIEKVELSKDIEAISATQKRKEMGL